MFNYIKGTITNISDNCITLENNSIGYIIKTPYSTKFQLNSEEKIYTYIHIREDLLELYGFKSEMERNFFLLLISVKGLGPKTALSILSDNELEQITNAINTGNAKFFQKISGIGVKASQQIILDLHGKINIEDSKKNTNPKIEQIIDALKSLGYKQHEIKGILPIMENQLDLDINQLIKLALKNLNNYHN